MDDSSSNHAEVSETEYDVASYDEEVSEKSDDEYIVSEGEEKRNFYRYVKVDEERIIKQVLIKEYDDEDVRSLVGFDHFFYLGGISGKIVLVLCGRFNAQRNEQREVY